jgi:hypothetical protein
MAAAVTLLVMSTSAIADECPILMTEIDTILATETHSSAEIIEKIQHHRSEGEELHNAGKHEEAVHELNEALGVIDGHESDDHG